MLKFLLLLVIFCSISGFTKAKKFNGRVVNERNKPIEFANIAAYSLPDSALIKGVVTNKNGEFTIELEPKFISYYFQISFVGYATQILKTIDRKSIVLKEDAKLLEEVAIRRQQKIFQIKNGNIVAKISGTILEDEINMVEMLRKIPGMTLKNGIPVSLTGGTPIIYINGRRIQSSAELSQLDVKNVNSVELNTNPGSEYDASTGAVLLITTKKRAEGLSVQYESMVRKSGFLSHDNSVKVSYKQNRVALFGQLGYSNYQTKTRQYLTTTVFTPDTVWVNNINLESLKSSSPNMSYTIGSDISLTKKSSLGIKYDGYSYKFDGLTRQPLTLNANGKQVEQIEGTSTYNNHSNRHYVNGYYHLTFNEKLKLEVYLDLLKTAGSSNQIVSELSSVSGYKKTNIRSLSTNRLAMLYPKLQYDITKKIQLLTGVELSNVAVRSDLKYTPTTFRDQQNINAEDKGAAYANFTYTGFKGLLFAAGVRYERVKFRFEDYLEGKNSIYRTYSNLFPNLLLSYKSASISQSLSYRSGINRPSFSQLSSNIFYINQLSYQEGNPKLVPEISHNFQYSLSYRFIYFSLKYKLTKNFIRNDFVSESASAKIVKGTYTNNSNINNQFEAVLNLQHSFGFYRPSLTLLYVKNFMKVPVNNSLKLVSKPFSYINFNNDLKFSENIQFNVEYTYNGSGSAGFIYYKSMHVFNVRIQKYFFNKNLQVSLAAADIFRKKINRYYGQINHIKMSNIDDQDVRSLSLNVIWRFNNYKKTVKDDSPAKDDINRL